ncbi:MAG: glycosyltransferase [Clostridia bacterium]|nr:glycosyltransferase [Clostridia bacterium]
MNTNFKYRATVIIPVYNRGDMVHIAFNSLLEQTIPFDQLQVLIVNDGSTDNSLEICRELTKNYDNVTVLDKPNGGLSSTRNFGLDHAEGKYIIYLDDDDTFSPETIKAVTDFFDTCYDEVDLVTYRINRYTEGKKIKWNHYRYRYLKKTGVYDLNELPMALQTTINVCVKNQFENNVRFDETVGYMEDQVYNNEILSKKFKIGFCSEGEYRYNRHMNTIVSALTSAYSSFEKMMKYFEDLFAKYDEVPPYIQCSYLHNLSYRMKDNILFPYHYSEEDFQKAMDRISKLLEKVDERVIFKTIPIDEFYKTYFYTLKPNKKATVNFTEEMQSLMLGEERLMKRVNVTLVARRFYFTGNKMRIVGYLRTPFFAFSEKPEAFVVFSDNKTIPVDLYPSSFSYYYCEHKCANNWSFDITVDLDETVDFTFCCKINGVNYPCRYEFTTNIVARPNKSGFIFMKNRARLQLKDNVFKFEKLSNASYKLRETKRFIHLLLKNYKDGLKYFLVKMMKKKRIWLYNDNLYTVKDNAYYQFKHDFNKNDGIKRYYILDGDPARMKGLFTEEEQKHVITFGSRKHILLYLACEKILTSFCEASSFTPIIQKYKRMFFDLTDFEVVYLQHGILHATTPTKYSKDRVFVDRIVVSSHFELENFVNNYGYNPSDLIPTGMPRYDYTDISKKPQRKILYAPSWRDKLVGKYVNRKRVFNDAVLSKSTYYKGIVAFLTNPDLLAALEKYDVTIEFKPHPNFTAYAHLFEPFLNDRITLAARNVQLEDYSLFITDFSSFNFDFLYQNRQLLYYVPDYDEFKCGAVTFYRDLDLKFEDGFGDFTRTAEDAAAAVIRRIEADFVTEEKYRERIENFFISKGNHCEQLYNYLMNE